MSFITQTSLGGGLSSGTVNTSYAEITSVSSNISTTVITYTTPLDGSIFLQKVDCAGDNIARFDILINSSVIATQRTEFTELNETFLFAVGLSNGLKLNPGDLIVVKVTHFRPFLGSFEARLQTITF